MCGEDITKLMAQLGNEEAVRLARGAKAARNVEEKTKKGFDDYFALLEQKCLIALHDGLPPPELDVLSLLLENAYFAMDAAFSVTPKIPNEENRARLAKYQPIKLPSTPAELRVWWDMVRKNKAPARIQAQADLIKKAYLKKTQELWKKFSETFRQGQVWNQDDAKVQIKKIFAVPKQRARVITNTETTRYFNQARSNFYNSVDAVTHYLFISIRDSRTTDWCKGRNGLVYKKGSAILKKETPPIHYQCRSEITPLIPFNKLHKRLIDDKSRARENHHPKPLLPGWNE